MRCDTVAKARASGELARQCPHFIGMLVQRLGITCSGAEVIALSRRRGCVLRIWGFL
jgi:hypothetical protein